MHVLIKKKLERTQTLIYGITIAIASLFKPVIILFLIPASLIFSKKKPFKNIALLFLGFLLIYAPFAYKERINPQAQALLIYNVLKSNIIDTNLGEVRIVEQGEIVDDFEEGTDRILKKGIDDNVEFKYNRQVVYEGKRSLEVQIEAPLTEDAIISRDITPKEWNKFDYLNIWIKNYITDVDENCWFGIRLIDEDGGSWRYDNNGILKQPDWTLLKIPLASLKNDERITQGDGKMGKIREYRLVFSGFKSGGPYTHRVIIDKMYLSKI